MVVYKNMHYILIGLTVAILALTFVIGKDSGVSTDDTHRTSQEVTQSVGGETEVISTVSLDLSGNGLIKAPSYIFERTDIEELNLSNNELEGSLQAEVRHLQNLKVLDLSNNNFTGVPAEVGQLNNLEILNLSNNKLTGLPYELGNLSKLRVLDVSGNLYSEADLLRIREGLPASTVVKTQ